MIPKIREAFNAGFREEFYENLKNDIDKTLGEPAAFRISETPAFIPKEVKKEVFEACEAIIDQL